MVLEFKNCAEEDTDGVCAVAVQRGHNVDREYTSQQGIQGPRMIMQRMQRSCTES